MKLPQIKLKQIWNKFSFEIMIIAAILVSADIFIYIRFKSLLAVLYITLAYLVTLAVICYVFIKDKQSSEKDILEARKLTKQIERKEERFRNTLNSFNEVFWQYNLVTRELELSEKWTELTGYKNHGVGDITEIMGEIMYNEDKLGFTTSLNNYMDELTPFFECNFRIMDSKSNFKWFYIKGIKEVEIDNEVNASDTILAGFISDVTVRKYIEEKITHMAYFDALTELPNKTYIQNYLKDAIVNSIKNNTIGALVFIDVDDFKIINTTLGHDYGDQLLKIISELLKVTLGDDRVIARIGGDEFLLVLENVQDKNEVKSICMNIIGMFKYPFEIGDKSIYSSVSIGAVMFPEDGTDVNVLFKNADAAMHKSKELNKNTYCFFDNNMTLEYERKTQIGNLLREAIDKNELSIMYQPQYSLETGKIVNMEALLRWNSRELGSISPAEFIPIAENTGTINMIGRWVFQQVCEQNKAWKNMGFEYGAIAINISTIQVQNESFVDFVKETIRENELDPTSVELEITETILMKNITLNERKLHQLKRMGINIAIDDFGTGYSSLNYLTYLPLDTLKMDKTFIENITTIKSDRILAENIVKLSHDLDMKVVAEGVETKEQLDILTSINCDIIQGYYFSRPLSKEDVEKKLAINSNGGE